MAIVSTMILRSMRLIGEKSRGATLDTNEQAECLVEFNTFLDSLPTQRLYCYQLSQVSTTITASTVSLTIGTNGTFATPRPVRLVDPCFIRDANGFDTPLEIVNAQTYGEIVDKDAGFTVPTMIFYDQGFSATSTGTLFLYPAPSANLTLFINGWQTLSQVSTLSQDLALPPGYRYFLEANFAQHLAAGQTPISQELAVMIRESRGMVKSANLPNPVMEVEPGALQATRRAGNIFTGG